MRKAVITGQSFWVASALLMLVQMVAEYQQCAGRLPALATEIVLRVSELLTLFNSLSRQMVLGRGAVQTGALPAIQEKHLALCAQCATMVIALFPHLRASLEYQLQTKQKGVMSEFDKVSPEFVQHRKEIFGGLVSMVKERVESCFRGLQACQWDVDWGSSSSDVMQSFNQDLVKFHDAVSAILPPDHLMILMGPVFSLLGNRFAEFFSRLEIQSSSGKLRVHDDVTLLIKNMQDMKATADHLLPLERVRSKRFPGPT